MFPRPAGPGVERNFGHGEVLIRHSALAEGIFSDELEHGGAAKVVAAITENVLMNERGMQLEERARARGIAPVHPICSAAKQNAFNALIVAQIKLPGQSSSFYVLFSRAQLESPCSRAMVSWGSLKLTRAENIARRISPRQQLLRSRDETRR